MKSQLSIILSLLLWSIQSSGAAPDTTALKSSEGAPSDTEIVIGDTIIPKAPALPKIHTKTSMEMLNQSSHTKAIDLLGDRGIAYKNSRIIAIGFEKDSLDSSQKSLVIIILDTNNQPQKNAIKINAEFYRNFYSKTDTAAEKSAQTATQGEHETSVVQIRQDGRVYFMLNTALKSLWVYPANLVRAFPEINGQVVAGLSLLTLGGSLYGSYLFTKNRDLGYGRVEFMNFGGDLGGYGYPNLLGAFLSNVGNENTEKLAAWMGMIGYPLGIYLGSKVQFTGNYEYGNASIMTTMSKWGLLYGFLLPNYFDLREDDYLSFATGLSMVLVPAGFYIGYRLVGDNHYSSGRSILIMITSIMGTATGALIPTLWESEESKIYTTMALLGHSVGTYMGFTFMKDRSYNFGQGLFMAASAIVGGAIAEAPLLIAKVSGDSHQAYTIMGMAGAWGGLAVGEFLARSLFEKTPHDKRTASAISFPGVCELPLLFLSQKCRPKAASPSYDIRGPLASARVMEIRF